MFLRLWLTVACLLIGTGVAFGSTFTYTSQPLQVGGNGGTGATQIVISFRGHTPRPGRCTLTQSLQSFDDGATTLASLQANGFVLRKSVINDNDKIVRLTYATVCLGTDGQTVTGQYQIYFTYNQGNVSSDFFANNLKYSASADLVELDLYLGGEVPQVYSNYSTTQGTWVITP